MKIRLLEADYRNKEHARIIGLLMDAYARDPMGGGQALDQSVTDNLANALATVPNAFTILGYAEGKPAGLVNCFGGFSTFLCKPLLNLHDVFVLQEFRGIGLCQRMLSAVELRARNQGCCKLTMEVLEGNRVAQKAYRKFGFEGYELDSKTGKALFWQKRIA